MRPDESIYLLHMAGAVDRALGYIAGMDEAAFGKNALVQDGVIRQLEIIGEAARHITSESRRAYPSVRWDEMAGMRDKLIHGYFGVDLGRVWLTAAEDLPVLRDQITAILADCLVRRRPHDEEKPPGKN